MKKEIIKRVFTGGWNNFKRNSYVSLGTTGVMILVLLLFLGLITLNFLSATIVASLQDKVDISVYFKTEASEGEIMGVKSDLEHFVDVERVEYISRDQALTDFKELHAGDALIQESLAELDVNPLQASLNVKAFKSSQYESIVSFIEGNKFRVLIDKINFYENEQVINRIERMSNGLEDGGFIATIILTVIAVLVMFNTIRLTIYSQKQEIEIMRLVGGSSWYIRSPYMIEGGLYGLFAAIVTFAIFFPAIYFVSPKVEIIMPGVGLMSYFTANIFTVTGVIAGIGILLGIISSLIAIRKFLKV